MTTEELEDQVPEEDEFDDSEIELDEDALEAELLELDDDDDVPTPDDDVDDEDDADAEEDGEEALDELEAEELDMLTDDETSETLVVDEAAEMRQIRREELAMDRRGADEASENEFVCARCFLVLKTSQLADGRRKICQDCAA
jgi:Domain of unknown function (DUF4193)